jgi:hypothetical protein
MVAALEFIENLLIAGHNTIRLVRRRETTGQREVLFDFNGFDTFHCRVFQKHLKGGNYENI